jgi:guanylate kinase
VSHTTRKPRPGEDEGKDYFFISETSFRQKIARGEFIEWVENFGQFYGTSIATIDSCRKEGCDLIVDVETRGAGRLKERYPAGIFVFVLPPSLAELKNRLIKRGFDGEEEMRRRLDKACDEIKEVAWYDYVIFNECLDEAADRLRAIYMAEKSRRERLMGRIDVFLKK